MIKSLEYIINLWTKTPFYYVLIRWDTSIGIASDIIRISLVKATLTGRQVTFIRTRVPFGRSLFRSKYPSQIYSVLESDVIRRERIIVRLLLECYYGIKYLVLSSALSFQNLRFCGYRQYLYGHEGLYDGSVSEIEHSNSNISLRRLCRAFRDLPTIHLASDYKYQCAQILKQMGVINKWYVCLHIRSSHFYDDDAVYRNASIKNYYEAIDYIIQSGGVVIRVGDSIDNFIDLPRDGLIDYPNTEYKSELMDLYLIENCRFYIGTQSGPIDTALLFNKPVLSVNSLHFAIAGTGTHNLTIYKRIRDTRSGFFLSFQESMAYYQYFITASHREFCLQYEWIENTKDEITDSVKEMILGLNAPQLPLTQLQRRANRILRKKSLTYNFWRDLGHAQALCSRVLVGRSYLENWARSIDVP